MKCAYFDSFGPKLFRVQSTHGYSLPLRVSEAFAPLLQDFINAPFETQKYYLTHGDSFLISYIKPIIKAADLNPTAAKSYRPISVYARGTDRKSNLHFSF